MGCQHERWPNARADYYLVPLLLPLFWSAGAAQTCSLTGLDGGSNTPLCVAPEFAGRRCPVASMNRKVTWERRSSELVLQAYQHAALTGEVKPAMWGSTAIGQLTGGKEGETELKLWFAGASAPCATATVNAIGTFLDGFEGNWAWGKFEEIVNGSCYVTGVGDVSRSSDVSYRGAWSALAWANKHISLSSNHLIGNIKLSDRGRPGAWTYNIRAFVDPGSEATCQTGPEFSMQNTRQLDGRYLTTIAGIQYRGNPFLEGSDLHSWAVWAEDAPGHASWQVLANEQLQSGTWYSISLEADFDANRYIGFTLRGPGVSRRVDLRAYKIAQESRFTEQGFWLTLESENLWSCNKPKAYSCKVYYDDVNLAPAGSPVADTVANGASFLPQFSPGSWATVFGTDLAPIPAPGRVWEASEIVNGKLPVSLEGVQVTIGGQPAAIYYVSPDQLNVEAPDGLPDGDIDVQVSAPGGQAVVKGQIRQAAPAFLIGPRTVDRSYVAAIESQVDPDGVVVYIARPELLPGVRSRPAKPGDIISVYGTGFGPSNPPRPAGTLIDPAPLLNQVTVVAGGQDAHMQYAGLVSVGLDQLNLTVPDLPDGDYLITARVGDLSTQAGVYLSVQR